MCGKECSSDFCFSTSFPWLISHHSKILLSGQSTNVPYCMCVEHTWIFRACKILMTQDITQLIFQSFDNIFFFSKILITYSHSYFTTSHYREVNINQNNSKMFWILSLINTMHSFQCSSRFWCLDETLKIQCLLKSSVSEPGDLIFTCSYQKMPGPKLIVDLYLRLTYSTWVSVEAS